MTHDTFTGVFPAMTTPFHDDESIDHDTLREHARRLEAAGVDAAEWLVEQEVGWYAFSDVL